MSRTIDLTGQRFGRLTAVAPTDKRTCGKNVVWECKCDCGNTVYVGSGSLRIGETRSCGCWRKEKTSNLNRTHSGKNERLYGVWMAMRRRCYDPSLKGYQDYGGRGIEVCIEWRSDFSAFRKWALSSGYDPNAPLGDCTLERINVDGNYEPFNCKWITIKEQSLNKRNSLLRSYRGKTQNASLWDKELGFPSGTVARRYRRNWKYERIFTQPVNILT